MDRKTLRAALVVTGIAVVVAAWALAHKGCATVSGIGRDLQAASVGIARGMAPESETR